MATMPTVDTIAKIVSWILMNRVSTSASPAGADGGWRQRRRRLRRDHGRLTVAGQWRRRRRNRVLPQRDWRRDARREGIPGVVEVPGIAGGGGQRHPGLAEAGAQQQRPFQA